MREFLKGLELDKETIDTIMAEHAKLITEAKEETQSLKDKNAEYESKIEEVSKKSTNSEEIQKELDTLKKSIADEKEAKSKEEQDKILTDNIAQVFGDKKFTSEYAKNGLMNDIKTELAKVENKGKGIKDVFESLTKDSTGIFANDNEVTDMPPAGEVTDEVTKSMGEVKLNPMFKNYNQN